MSLYYLDDLTTVHHGGALDVLRAMPDESVHSIVTDPPYGLSNTDPRHVAETITRWVSGDREYTPSGRGFMGKEWDAFVPPVAVWDECLRVLKPGGHLLAFAGSRTADLMGLAIRLAGFDIRDSLAWLYGSGFPKSHDLGKSTEAEQWEGWGTALKPAFELIVLARKPLAEKTVAKNVLAHGTGAINVDGCRIAGESTRRTNTAEMGYHGGNLASTYQTGSDAGRWPANVLLDQHAAAWVDEQSGVLRSQDPATRGGTADTNYGNKGGASRFFYNAKAPKSERPDVDGVQHPTVKPLAIMRWLVRMVTPPDGVVLDPFVGSGTTVEAAILEEIRSVGIELSAEYLPLIEARIKRSTPTYTLEDLL